MTVADWYNSQPMQTVRQQITRDTALSLCTACYKEESRGYESRRIRENYKTVIFTEQAFDRSYQQSHWRDRFENTVADLPIDWHVDLGNECNLSCKMCGPQASSRIADQYRRWNILSDTRSNWTNNEQAWQNFLISLDQTPVRRLHFMGGEPLLSKRFREILDYLIDAQRTNISISFVTNGTLLDSKLIEKLQNFHRVDIEVSLESVYSNNHYIRQGSDTDQVIKNIQQLRQLQTDRFNLVLRSVPQLLNVNNYDQYIKWAWDLQLPVQGIPLTRPRHLAINVLPTSIRQNLIPQYQAVKQQILNSQPQMNTIAVGRDTSRLNIQLARECDAVISMLLEPEPSNVVDLRKELVEWLLRWDTVFGLDARIVYPEYREFLQGIGYDI